MRREKKGAHLFPENSPVEFVLDQIPGTGSGRS
jgi:hypothetical protein